MKSVVCRLPYTVRVPMWVFTVLVVFLVERFIKLSKIAAIVLGVLAVMVYFWLAISANSLFFWIL
jgi:hypothetical protein